MPKKGIKAEIRKPDMVMRSIGAAYDFVRINLKLCIVIAAACLVVASGVYGYALYEKKQGDKEQYALSQGIRSFQEYSATGKQDDLLKSEKIFSEIVAEKEGEAYSIAQLYLARIRFLQGKKDEALALYKEVLKGSPESTVKTLAQKAVVQLEKK
ncbi:MAG: hypothetical protein EHM36_15635 [Deltaproteobacteria bacterium]|nr:MAG: hypothetical protein EHM36_15635 [Deltaproteobacteria bacterium]